MGHTGPLADDFIAVGERTRLETLRAELGTIRRLAASCSCLTKFDDVRAQLTVMSGDAAHLEQVAADKLIELHVVTLLGS